MNRISFSLLPREIVVSILLRLPAFSLLKLRYVCKQWLEIISDDSFIHAHLSISSPTIMLPYEPKIDLGMDDEFDGHTNLRIGYIDIDQKDNNARFHHLFFLPKQRRIWASCNGLVLMTSHRRPLQVEIVNPVTNQIAKLPPPLTVAGHERRLGFEYLAFGLGFEPSSKEYKVVSIEFEGGRAGADNRCQIMTLGSNTWRLLDTGIPTVGKPCDCFYHGTQDGPGKSPISVDGALFLPILQKGILVMDLSNERWYEIPLPDNNIREYFFFELGGRLSGMALISCSHYDIWVLERLGGNWVKLHSIGRHATDNIHIYNLEPVGSLKNGELIVFEFGSAIYVYDMRIQQFIKIKVAGKRSKWVYFDECLPHVNSLVSL